jgi:hypothetical protein
MKLRIVHTKCQSNSKRLLLPLQAHLGLFVCHKGAKVAPHKAVPDAAAKTRAAINHAAVAVTAIVAAIDERGCRTDVTGRLAVQAAVS